MSREQRNPAAMVGGVASCKTVNAKKDRRACRSVRCNYPTPTADVASRAHGFRSMVDPTVRFTPTVLLYSPRPRSEGDADFEAALQHAGYHVVRSSTVSGCVAHLGHADAVVLDDPPWELIRSLVAALDEAPLPIPRVWVSTWSMAPALAGKLGIEALLLERDVALVVEQVQRTIATSRPPLADELPLRRPIRRATTTPELHPHASVLFEDEPSEPSDVTWP